MSKKVTHGTQFFAPNLHDPGLIGLSLEYLELQRQSYVIEPRPVQILYASYIRLFELQF